MMERFKLIKMNEFQLPSRAWLSLITIMLRKRGWHKRIGMTWLHWDEGTTQTQLNKTVSQGSGCLRGKGVRKGLREDFGMLVIPYPQPRWPLHEYSCSIRIEIHIDTFLHYTRTNVAGEGKEAGSYWNKSRLQRNRTFTIMKIGS